MDFPNRPVLSRDAVFFCGLGGAFLGLSDLEVTRESSGNNVGAVKLSFT